MEAKAAEDPNVARFEGAAEVYNLARPRPPTIIRDYLASCLKVRLDLLPQRPAAANSDRERSVQERVGPNGQKEFFLSPVSVDDAVPLPPLRILDLGCGTGLSTFLWDGFCQSITGLDPGADMLSKAIRGTPRHTPITFRVGYSDNSGCESASVDLVTCSQSLHWMPPEPTYKEVHRVLRDGGIMAAFDCDWPPNLSSWEAEQAFVKCLDSASGIGGPHKKHLHAQRMKDSCLFRHVKEMAFHSVEQADSKRLMNIIISMGGINEALKAGRSRESLHLDEAQKVFDQHIGDKPQPIYWTYTVRMAFK